jgi:hypothetical protein
MRGTPLIKIPQTEAATNLPSPKPGLASFPGGISNDIPTRSASEGFRAGPRLRFGLVCSRQENLPHLPSPDFSLGLPVSRPVPAPVASRTERCHNRDTGTVRTKKEAEGNVFTRDLGVAGVLILR